MEAPFATVKEELPDTEMTAAAASEMPVAPAAERVRSPPTEEVAREMLPVTPVTAALPVPSVTRARVEEKVLAASRVMEPSASFVVKDAAPVTERAPESVMAPPAMTAREPPVLEAARRMSSVSVI